MTPLHMAAEKGRLKVVESLVENKANIEAKDINGVSICYSYSTVPGDYASKRTNSDGVGQG